MGARQEEPPQGQRSERSVPVDRAAGGKTRVFLADDHRLVREGLTAVLEKTALFKVVGACGDGLDVVRQVAQVRPDVVVLDLEMPGLNGIDVCHQLNRTMPDTGVLILSMHDDEAFVIRALRNGAKGYLLKESAGEDLANALKSVMAKRIYIGPGIDKSVLSRLQSPTDPYERLTPRERQVLQLIAEGLTNKRVAKTLGLAVKTIDTHRMRLMKKLDIHDQTTLVKFFLSRNGWLDRVRPNKPRPSEPSDE